MDLETKSMNSPRPQTVSRRRESRIEELTNRLEQSSKDSTRIRSADKNARDAKFQLAESDRQRLKLEEEVKGFEDKIDQMRTHLDALVSSCMNSRASDD